MTVVRVKGLKRYRVKGKWFAYHRKTGIRIKAEYGTGGILRRASRPRTQTGRPLRPYRARWGCSSQLIAHRRNSRLAPATRHGYGRMINFLQPINDMPLVELTPQFVAGLRDRIAAKHGRRQANYVMAVISVACEFGKEHGIVRENPVKGVRRVRRSRETPNANRPWTEEERRTVLVEVPYQLRVAVALAMFTGLRKGDVLALTKAAIRAARFGEGQKRRDRKFRSRAP